MPSRSRATSRSSRTSLGRPDGSQGPLPTSIQTRP
jgi:hypothetical protein